MPLLRTAMYAKGIELYCAITVDDRDTWLPTVTHIALEGHCFMLSACQFLQRHDLPSGYPTERFPTSQDVLIRGGSCIISPLGQLLAGPEYDEECVLTADIDRNEITNAKFENACLIVNNEFRIPEFSFGVEHGQQKSRLHNARPSRIREPSKHRRSGVSNRSELAVKRTHLSLLSP